MPFGGFLQRRGRSSALSDERGAMLIEILVSAVSLIGLGFGTLAVIDRAGEASGMNRARSVATSLAQNDQDQMRQLPYSELLNRPAAPRTVQVDGRDYTVVSQLEFVNDTVGTSDCSTTSKSAKYLKMTTEVSSPGSDLNVPVKMETIRAPTLGQAGTGSAAIRLTRGDGSGTPSVPVTAGAQAGATNEFGCAFIDELPEGNVNVTYSKAGHVNENGLNSITASVAVRTDTTSVVTGNYDIAAAGVINFTNRRIADPNTIAPADRTDWISASVVNEGITSVPVGKRRFAIGSPDDTLTAGELFPFSSAYGFYAGECDGNNPEGYVDGSGVSQTVAPGATQQVAVDLPRGNVRVRSNSSNRSGYRVYAYPDTNAIAPNPTSTMEGCAEAIKRSGTSSGLTPTVTNSSGNANLDLPYGIWTVCVDNNSGSRRYEVRYNNTPDGTGSPLAPSKVSGNRGLDINIASVPQKSGLCP